MWRLAALMHLRMMNAQNSRPRARRMGMMGMAPAPQSIAAPSKSAAVSPKLGFWARLYTQGLDLEPEAAEAVFDGMKPMIGGFTGGLVGGFGGGFGANGAWMLMSGRPELVAVGSIFATVGAVGASLGILLPRFMLKKYIKTPLTITELDYLIECAGEDNILRDYLKLAKEALGQTRLTEPGEKNLREAIQALGEAIDRLPPAPLPGQDVATLQQEVAQARAEMVRETDPVVLASQERRVNALESSLKSVQRAMTLSRRSRALRDEVQAQIESVRLGMASLNEGGETGANFGAIADSVRRVSAEAGSIAEAKNELDSFLTPTIAPADEPAVQTLQAGQRN